MGTQYAREKVSPFPAQIYARHPLVRCVPLPYAPILRNSGVTGTRYAIQGVTPLTFSEMRVVSP